VEKMKVCVSTLSKGFLALGCSRPSPISLNLAQRGARDLHDLLPSPPQEDVGKENFFANVHQDFSRCMKDAGIGRIAFLRHGKTAPKPEGGKDFERILTDEGRNQAKISGASFGRNDLPPYFPSVLVSPAPRTMETAALFLDAATGAGLSSSSSNDTDAAAIELKPVSEVYDGTMQPEGSKLFAKIGYAPLSEYVQNKRDDKDRDTAQRVLGSYAHNMVNIIYNHARTINNEADQKKNDSATLLFVGHAIYLPAAALGVASLVGCDHVSQEMILTTVTQEAEGYLVDLNKDPPTARYLSRPNKNISHVNNAIRCTHRQDD